jgi:hypothetical protein
MVRGAALWAALGGAVLRRGILAATGAILAAGLLTIAWR